MRTYVAAAFFGIGLLVGLVHTYKGQIFTGLVLASCGLYVALSVLVGIGNSLRSSGFGASALILGVVGIVGTFLSNRAFEAELQAAQAGAYAAFAAFQNQCKPSEELSKIQSFGIKACGLQSTKDQISAAEDLAKGLYLGPATSLADGAVSLITGNLNPNYCALAFNRMYEICPTAFSVMSKRNKETLLRVVR